MSINHLYHTWFTQIRQLRPQEHLTRLRNFVWLVVGIYSSRAVHLHRVAGKIPGAAKQLSLVRRLERLLDNAAIRVRIWYDPVARALLQAIGRSVGEIRLIVDATKVSFHHQLLMVAVAFRHRALPLAWTWVRRERGHSAIRKQLALLAYVCGLLPAARPVLLVGDSEFGAVAVLQQLEEWGWHYVLRHQVKHLVQLAGTTAWQRFGDLVQRPGQSHWLGRGRLTREFAHPTNLLAHWAAGYEQPWLLSTNLPTARAALQAYRRRMWIEEMFGDWKGHGFDLESSHLCHYDRLSRLTLVVALLYLWLVTIGIAVIRKGQRHLVDRVDRRDLCIFQIGLRWVERCLTNVLPLSIRLCPTLGQKVSGG